jgi:hypothetical protein
MPEGDARFPQVVGRHLDVHFVSDADADEIFAHFAGYMREHLMAIGQGYAKHSPRQNLGNRSSQFYRFFFGHNLIQLRDESLSYTDPQATVFGWLGPRD